jgi:hypothetical protein
MQTQCVLVATEENWRRQKNWRIVLVIGVPKAVIDMLGEDREDPLAMVSKVFNQLRSFELAWNKFFTIAFERLNTPICLYDESTSSDKAHTRFKD